MATYVYRDGRMVDKATGEPMNTGPWRPTVPYVRGDMEPYLSPVDGRYISGEAARRDDLKRHGCVEWDPSFSPTKGKFKNKRFAKKHGLTVSEEYRD